jgi:hypothetical protein
MCKVKIAFGSFLLGIFCACLVAFLIHSSTHVQASQAIAMPGVEPVIPPIRSFLDGSTVNGSTQGIDGLSCVGCLMNVSELTYGGGAFNIANSVFPRETSVQLRGAALNTYNLLRALGALHTNAPARPQLKIKAGTSLGFVSSETAK